MLVSIFRSPVQLNVEFFWVTTILFMISLKFRENAVNGQVGTFMHSVVGTVKSDPVVMTPDGCNMLFQRVRELTLGRQLRNQSFVLILIYYMKYKINKTL